MVQAWRTTKNKPPGLEPPRVLHEVLYLWEYYLDVAPQGVLSWGELHAWSSLRGVHLNDDELHALRAINKVQLEALND